MFYQIIDMRKFDIIFMVDVRFEVTINDPRPADDASVKGMAVWAWGPTTAITEDHSK